VLVARVGPHRPQITDSGPASHSNRSPGANDAQPVHELGASDATLAALRQPGVDATVGITKLFSAS
jgi:hypothetical protein